MEHASDEVPVTLSTADEAACVVQTLEAEGLIVPQLVFQDLFSIR